MFATVTLLSKTLLLVTLVAAIAITAYIAIGRYRARRVAQDCDRISATIKDYFARSGAQVTAHCVPQPTQGHFLACVDSEPLKRFRYSHIVEASLIAHVEKLCALEIDRVYWRFPLPAGQPQALNDETVAPEMAKSHADEYVTQGLLRARAAAGYEVDEGSWDQFEKARQSDAVMPASPAGGKASPQ